VNSFLSKAPIPILPALGISTSVFGRAFTAAHIDALDDARVDVVEVVGPVDACPFDRADVRRELRARLRDARVRVRSAHLPYGGALDLSLENEAARRNAVAATAENLRAAASLGASLVVIHPSAEPITDAVRPARQDAARRSLADLAPLAASVGIPLAVECLPRTCLGNTATELASLLDDVDPDVIGACIDVNHINLRESDLTAAVEVLSARLLTLHCSDNDGVDERHWLPGDPAGVVDWMAFMRGLIRARYGGPFLYEVRSQGLPIGETVACIVENYRGFVASKWDSTKFTTPPES
jgi:sugar phosphate isomerase/epimerase